MLHMIYPESRMVTEEMVMVWAHDTLVNQSYRALPADQQSNDDAMEQLFHSTPKPSVEDAIAILEDAGEVTFTR